MVKNFFTKESLSAFLDEIKIGNVEPLSIAKSYTDTKVTKMINETTVSMAKHATSADSAVEWNIYDNGGKE